MRNKTNGHTFAYVVLSKIFSTCRNAFFEMFQRNVFNKVESKNKLTV